MKPLALKLFFLLFATFFCACGQSDTLKTETPEGVSNTPPDSIYPAADILIATHSEWARKHYPDRILEFKANPLENNDIVFLGNSITEQGGAWHEKVDNAKAKNRGISGDTTDGVLARLGELIYYKPAQVFLLIGINDLFREDMSSQKVHDNILQIVDRIHKENPSTEIFVQTILPTTTVSLKTKINETNALLKASETKSSYTLIHLYDEFTTEHHLMDMNFSTDGVHLNEKGYKVWVNKIKNLIIK